VNFGVGFDKVIEQSYTLFLDRTPPTISIVSPEDGDFVAIGDRTDVLIKSFDKFGIQTVEVSKNNGPFVELNDPSRYSFEATPDDIQSGITVTARATDPNNNVSVPATITVFPYDAEAGAPRVDVISPDNGTQFYEGETVTFEVLLRNVTEADFFLDIGGVEADPSTAISVSRTASDPERQFITATIPEVDENIVVIARLQRGSLRGFKFLNIENNETLDESPIVRTIPSNSILSGTQLIVESDIPVDMPDYSNESSISIVDPLLGGDSQTAEYGRRLATTVSNLGEAVSIVATLKDRSGNENVANSQLSKIGYFTGEEPQEYFSVSADESIDFLAKLPTSNKASEIIFGVNRASGGYRVVTSQQQLVSQNTGQLLDVKTSGSRVLLRVRDNGVERLDLFKPTASGLVALSSDVLNGRLLELAGSTVWLEYGEQISASLSSESGLVPALTADLIEPIIDVSAQGDDLLVLTESGLAHYQLSIGNVAKVGQSNFVALEGYSGFTILPGNELFAWTNSTVSRFSMQLDGGLSSALTSPLDGQVIGAETDGKLAWIKVRTNDGVNWLAYLNGELVGRSAASSEFEQRIFTAGRGYQLVRNVDDLSIGDSVSYQRIVSQDIGEMSAATSELKTAFEIELSAALGETDLGYQALRVEDSLGNAIPATASMRNGEPSVLVRFVDIQGLQELSLVAEFHGGRVSELISINPDVSTNTENISPASASTLTHDAYLPITLTHADSARVAQASLLVNQSAVSVAGLGSNTMAWGLVEDSFELQHSINGNLQSLESPIVVQNAGVNANIIISSPTNNQSFKEGDFVRVNFATEHELADEFQYSEVSVLDFNRNVISRVLIGSSSSDLELRLPNVEQLDTNFIRVRSYFGDSYSFVEREVGVRIAPRLQVPTPSLLGLSGQAFVGSELNISLATIADSGAFASGGFAGYETRIEVYDDNGVLLASSNGELDFIVPDGVRYLTIVGLVSDAFGNQSRIERRVLVSPAIRPLLNTNASPEFDVALADGGQLWFARGRGLFDQNNIQVAELDANVVAIKRLTDRLLLALDNNSMVIVDPVENYQVVGTHPTTQNYVDLTVFGTNVVAIDAAGNLHAFTSSGNELSELSLKSQRFNRSGDEIFSNYVQPYEALSVSFTERGFEVLYEDALQRFEARVDSSQGDTFYFTSPDQIVGLSDATLATQHQGYTYIVTELKHYSIWSLSTIAKPTRNCVCRCQ